MVEADFPHIIERVEKKSLLASKRVFPKEEDILKAFSSDLDNTLSIFITSSIIPLPALSN
jgi:hypothetical protein